MPSVSILEQFTPLIEIKLMCMCAKVLKQKYIKKFKTRGKTGC